MNPSECDLAPSQLEVVGMVRFEIRQFRQINPADRGQLRTQCVAFFGVCSNVAKPPP